MFEKLTGKVIGAAKKAARWCKDKAQVLLGGGVAGGSLVAASDAAAQVTLPATGVDVSEYVGLLVTGLGGVVGSVLAAYVAFLLIRKAKGYLSKI